MNITRLQSNYIPDIPADDIYRLHRQWGDAHPTTRTAPPATGDLQRIGYIGGDFRRHSCMYFFEPVARHSRYQTTCFATAHRPDDTTARIMQTAEYVDVEGMSARKMAKEIRRRGIQILVDLSGHTQNNALKTFTHRPAPVQCSYIGYPNTIGSDAIDYRIVDHITDQPGEEQYHTERLIRLPGCFLTFDAPRLDIPIRNEVHIDQTVFASFANPLKIGAETVRIWSEILRAVPNSHLFLKSSKYKCAEIVAGLRAEFAKHGIGDDGMTILHAIPRRDHLEAYNAVDCQLDTFPYNGTATTCESLWMGVPVVTMKGERHRSRVSASLLTAADCPELIADTIPDYIRIAIETAQCSRQRYRPYLRDRVLASRLCDGPRLVSELDDAYSKIWANARA